MERPFFRMKDTLQEQRCLKCALRVWYSRIIRFSVLGLQNLNFRLYINVSLPLSHSSPNVFGIIYQYIHNHPKSIPISSTHLSNHQTHYPVAKPTTNLQTLNPLFLHLVPPPDHEITYTILDLSQQPPLPLRIATPENSQAYRSKAFPDRQNKFLPKQVLLRNRNSMPLF